MNKVVVITGASSGIGYATAKKLLSDGYIVYGAARSTDKMAPLTKKGLIPLKLDVTDDQALTQAVDKIIKEQGRVDVLFNNAGYGVYGSVEEIPLDVARRQFEVNLFGMARLTQLIIPHMREAGSGTIINTSSMGGKMYLPFGAWYHASKHAIEGYSDCLRLELEQFGIKVVIIEPGAINTNFGVGMLKIIKKYSSSGPYKRMYDAFISSMESKGTNPEKAASPPSVIADLVSKVIKTANPKTRYPAGKMARLMLFLRKYLPDRTFDKLVTSFMLKN